MSTNYQRQCDQLWQALGYALNPTTHYIDRRCWPGQPVFVWCICRWGGGERPERVLGKTFSKALERAQQLGQKAAP